MSPQLEQLLLAQQLLHKSMHINSLNGVPQVATNQLDLPAMPCPQPQVQQQPQPLQLQPQQYVPMAVIPEQQPMMLPQQNMLAAPFNMQNSMINNSAVMQNEYEIDNQQSMEAPISAVPQVPSLASSIVNIIHKNMMMDPGNLSKKRVKKDMLWKPLFRGFRTYFRDRLSQYLDISAVMEPFSDSDLATNLEKQGQRFLVSERAPASLVENQLNLHALVVMALPVAASNMKKVLESVPTIRANLPTLLSPFCAVFRENSIPIRQKFFRNELVQFMWSKYIHDEAAFVSQYFKGLTSDPEKQIDVVILLKDIFILSNRLGFQIIRPELLQIAT